MRTLGINTYPYMADGPALDCIKRVAGNGHTTVEIMMYPGHFWPDEMSRSNRSALRSVCEEEGVRVISTNIPNIDINLAGASREVRDYSLGLISGLIDLSGEIGSKFTILGPGKANPLMPLPTEVLTSHFRGALDRLAPLAEAAGVTLLVENMPFAFLPDAESLFDTLEAYGNPKIGIIYDVGNGHFIGEDPADGLRTVKSRLGLVHCSDTFRTVYRHAPIGQGDLPLSKTLSALDEINYREPLILEIISEHPDRDIAHSVRRVREADSLRGETS
jgi:L-ribulose-5-phosphate 3-epimerase